MKTKTNTCLFLATAFILAAYSTTPAQAGVFKPQQLPQSVNTSIGKIEVRNDENSNSTVWMNGNKVYDPEGMGMYLLKIFDGKDKVIVATQNSGPNACPIVYSFLTIEKNGKSKITDDFGICSKEGVVGEENGIPVITIKTNMVYRFVFENGVVKLNGKAAVKPYKD